VSPHLNRVRIRVGGKTVDLHRAAINALCRFDDHGVLPAAGNPHATIPGGLLGRGWARHARGRIILTTEALKVRAALAEHLARIGYVMDARCPHDKDPLYCLICNTGHHPTGGSR
jgi:hypothetical protein